MTASENALATRSLSSPLFYQLLGRITRASADLHLTVDDLINGFFGGDVAIDCLISDMSFANMMHAARALADRLVSGEKELSELCKLLDEAQRLYEFRNKMVHGIWLLNKESPQKMDCARFRAKGQLKVFRDTYTLADMRDLALSLEAARQSLDEFMQRKRFSNGTMFRPEAGRRRHVRRERSQKYSKKPGAVTKAI